MDFAQSARFVNGGLWEEGGTYLNRKTLSLERASADFILCVSNNWHKAAEAFMKDVHVPPLYIVDPTANAILNHGLTKVGLLGTKATMSGKFLVEEYTQWFGIEILLPSDKEQDIVDHIIFAELTKANFTESSRRIYLDVIDSLRARGAEGIILSCTEIPLLVSQVDRPNLPMFDTLKLHAEAAVSMALDA
jgi:aspartate racemase